jgi:glycosyltransferase involved in cell wall biosynthesis
MKRINVLQVNKLYYPHIGGVEKVVKDIAEGLRDKVNMKVLVCQPKGRGCTEEINGVSVVRAGSLGTYFSMPVSVTFPLLLNKLSRKSDIIHFHMPFPLGDFSYLVWRNKVKSVAWWHSDIVRQKSMLKIYKPYLLNFLNKVERIMVATSEHIENSEILFRFKNKCVVIPFGIDTKKYQLNEFIKKRAEQIYKTYGPRLILFVGRLIYYKGLEYLISAMQDIEGNLLIIGEGPLKANLEKLVATLGVNNKVSFLGKMSDEDLTAYFHACDVFALPSVANSEAFGLVQLEAMACGKPVINTALPTGVPKVSIHRETGITVKPKDNNALAMALNELLNNDQLRRLYGRNSKIRVEKEFSKDLMLERIFKLYQEVLD